MQLNVTSRLAASVSSREGADFVFVMFHGYGNDEREMIRIIEAVDPDASYCSFTGTTPRPYMGGHYWYPDGCSVAERRAACSAVGDAVTAMLDASIYAGRRLVLVGFSQGAYLSYRMVVEHPGLFDAAVLLSPSFRGEEHADPRELHDERCQTRFLLAYGSDDRTIPRDDQRTAHRVLEDCGRTTTHCYEGMGHAICDDEIRDIRAFLHGLPQQPVRSGRHASEASTMKA